MKSHHPGLNRFQDKVVVVTGGAQGMGSSHVRGFHAEGAHVVIADVLAEPGVALARELGGRSGFVLLDVRDDGAWAELVKITEDRVGPISVLVNNAGIVTDSSDPDGPDSPAAWRRVIDVNLVGAYLGTRAVTPSMRRAGGGAIVNISSVRGYSAAAGRTAYSASKWGMRGLTKASALELGPDNIRVNSVHPGMTRTEMHVPAPGRYEKLPIRRVGEPEEVTRMVLFVASDDASYSTGSEFIVDGGFLISGTP